MGEDSVKDDLPMLDIHANGIDLRERYGHLPALAAGQPKPWHVALVEFWRFVNQRRAVDLVRRVMKP